MTTKINTGMNNFTEQEINIMNEQIKKHHSETILRTTPRTVELYPNANWQGVCDLIDFKLCDNYVDEKYMHYIEYIKSNYDNIFKEMIFNQKEFVVIGKFRGEEEIYKTENFVTGNKIKVKIVRMGSDSRTYVDRDETLTITR